MMEEQYHDVSIGESNCNDKSRSTRLPAISKSCSESVRHAGTSKSLISSSKNSISSVVSFVLATSTDLSLKCPFSADVAGSRFDEIVWRAGFCGAVDTSSLFGSIDDWPCIFTEPFLYDGNLALVALISLKFSLCDCCIFISMGHMIHAR